MKMKTMKCLGALLTAVLMTSAAFAAIGTKDDAKALAEKAIAHVNAVGAEQALEDFTNNQSDWSDSEKGIYIYAYNFEGETIAHAVNAKQVGRNMTKFKDSDGVYPIPDGIKVAKTSGTGWVHFRWVSPYTKRMSMSHSYVIRIPGTDSYLAGLVYE